MYGKWVRIFLNREVRGQKKKGTLGKSLMQIKTSKSEEGRISGTVPPPDKSRRRKKAHQKLGKGPISGRRYMSALRTLGKVGSLLLLVSFVLAIFVYAYTSGKLDLSDIRFYGCKEVDSKRLEEIIRIDFPSNILRIDLSQLKGRLKEEIWVKQVEIRRVLPSKLVVYVQERIPSIILEIQNDLMIADQDGIILGHYAPKFRKLDVPVFRGVLGENAESYRLHQEENSARIRQAVLMLSELESGSPNYTKSISEVDVSDPKNLKIMLVDDTAEVYLGGENYLERFTTFMRYRDEYEKLKNQYEEFASIDLRFEDQIIYRPRRSEDGEKAEDLKLKR
jgi:cell division septal protein FtsQ